MKSNQNEPDSKQSGSEHGAVIFVWAFVGALCASLLFQTTQPAKAPDPTIAKPAALSPALSSFQEQPSERPGRDRPDSRERAYRDLDSARLPDISGPPSPDIASPASPQAASSAAATLASGEADSASEKQNNNATGELARSSAPNASSSLQAKSAAALLAAPEAPSAIGEPDSSLQGAARGERARSSRPDSRDERDGGSGSKESNQFLN